MKDFLLSVSTSVEVRVVEIKAFVLEGLPRAEREAREFFFLGAAVGRLDGHSGHFGGKLAPDVDHEDDEQRNAEQE